jgi:hypothetical protein
MLKALTSFWVDLLSLSPRSISSALFVAAIDRLALFGGLFFFGHVNFTFTLLVDQLTTERINLNRAPSVRATRVLPVSYAGGVPAWRRNNCAATDNLPQPRLRRMDLIVNRRSHGLFTI